jgi:ABC-type polysaccharide/polyol phosphate transport system ATPase subunit
MTPIIEVKNIGKCYPIYDNPAWRVGAKFGLPCKPNRELWALRNVNFEVQHGESIGIIGKNGAGKSTLLKIITSISRPTEGSLYLNGSIASILELGIGFHPDFSGRDNVYLNCALHGYTREETHELIPKIIKFSELEDYIDLPVRMYSTGMALRLAFAVSTEVDPDILIVDEALAVGDEHFRNKCLDRMNAYKDKGKTILFVSHDLATVRYFCSRVVLIDKGKMLACGKPEEVLDQYLEMVHHEKTASAPSLSSTPRWGSGEVEIEQTVLKKSSGNVAAVFDTFDEVDLELHYQVKTPVDGAVFGCLIYKSDGTYVHGSNHHWQDGGMTLQLTNPGERGVVRCRIPKIPLLPGEYYLTACCYNHSQAFPQAVDHWERACRFTISERMSTQHGMIALDTQWEHSTKDEGLHEQS